MARWFILLVIICCTFGFINCGVKDKGGCDSGSPPYEYRLDGLADGWDCVLVKKVESMGMLSPHVKAIARNNKIHLAYFESNIPEEPDEGLTYKIKYMVWDMDAMDGEEDEFIIEIDNCGGIGFALDSDNIPVVAYQGGEIRMGGQEKQSDTMFSIMGNDGVWDEYTGGIGEVDEERNPFYIDGLAGTDLSVAFDSTGDVHLAYQFKWEGIDTHNFGFPDLLYVNKHRAGLSAQAEEEPVEGNTYINNNTGYQNGTGYHCVVAVDKDDEPIIFYYAEFPRGGEFAESVSGLRIARKQDDVWGESEWVDEGCEIGFISNAGFDHEGNMAVAYYATLYMDQQGYSHTQCLKYAIQDSTGSWHVQLVDEITLCGNYCSLAFDASGAPAIAYYSLMSRSGYDLKDIKLARLNGAAWDHKVIASGGEVGFFNTLMFDENDKSVISSFSNTDKAIYLFYQE